MEVKPPANISAQDFRQLRGRIRANALAAATLAGHAENNLSVVLLLEWHGRRLLFPGDAEWSGSYGGEVKKGRSNSSWNVMWQERKADLSHPLDFLKIGHHGSVNATPWAPPDAKTQKEHPISQILDALLPRPAAGEQPTAKAIASTERTGALAVHPRSGADGRDRQPGRQCRAPNTWKTHPARTCRPANRSPSAPTWKRR